jgi:DNA invertase Pin-like site-specific DNA recombinase
VLNLSRAFRSASDALATEDEWRARGISIHLVDQGGQAVDTSTPAGWMFYAMLASMAEYERRVIRSNTKAGLARKRARGEVYSGSVFGLDRVAVEGSVPGKRGAPKDRLAPNADEQAQIERMRTLRAQGLTYAQIAARLQADGVRTKRGGQWRDTTVRNLVLRAR